jgi:hypothetical protein
MQSTPTLNLRGTYTGYQSQRQADQLVELWNGLELAADAVGVACHADAVHEEMDRRLAEAFAVMRDLEEMFDYQDEMENRQVVFS